MPVDLKQGLDTHAEIAGRLEGMDTSLHKPRCCRVAHDVWSILAAANRSPCTPQLADRLAHVVHNVCNALLGIDPVPSSQVR